jgi:hypothetical protein
MTEFSEIQQERSRSGEFYSYRLIKVRDQTNIELLIKLTGNKVNLIQKKQSFIK